MARGAKRLPTLEPPLNTKASEMFVWIRGKRKRTEDIAIFTAEPTDKNIPLNCEELSKEMW